MRFMDIKDLDRVGDIFVWPLSTQPFTGRVVKYDSEGNLISMGYLNSGKFQNPAP